MDRSWIHWHQLCPQLSLYEHPPLLAYDKSHQLLKVPSKKSVKWRIWVQLTLGRPSLMWRDNTPHSQPQTSSKSRNIKPQRIFFKKQNHSQTFFQPLVLGFHWHLPPKFYLELAGHLPSAGGCNRDLQRWHQSSWKQSLFYPFFPSKTDRIKQQCGEHSQKLWKSWNFRS